MASVQHPLFVGQFGMLALPIFARLQAQEVGQERLRTLHDWVREHKDLLDEAGCAADAEAVMTLDN